MNCKVLARCNPD
jgi:magnesium-transporting ATPase (P-type)